MCILTIKWVLWKLFAGQIHLFWLFAYFSFKHKEKEEQAMVAVISLNWYMACLRSQVRILAWDYYIDRSEVEIVTCQMKQTYMRI